MTVEYFVDHHPQRPPVHPGELLRDDVLPTMGISVSEFARRIRVSRQLLHRILNETHGITPEMALRIGKFVGNGPDLWIRMQQAHDLWQVEQTLREELATIEQFHVA
jgi:addiction module HigA family antidote